MEERRGIYERLAVHRVDTAGRTPEDIAAEIVDPVGGPIVSDQTRIAVGGDASYDVVIGTGLLGELPGLLGEGVERVLVVHPRALRATGEAVRDDLAAQGFSAFVAEVP